MVQVRKKRPATPRHAARLSRPIDGLLDAALFRALSDPTRLRLLACIAKCGRACTVGEIAGCCSVDLSVVSRHLAVLQRAGVLEAAKQGRTVFYTVRFEHVSTMLRALADAMQDCCPQGCAAGAPKGVACGNACC